MADLEDIGINRGESWQNVNGSLASALGINKDAIKKQLVSGFVQSTGLADKLDSMFGGNAPPAQSVQPVAPPSAQPAQPEVAPVPPTPTNPDDVGGFLDKTIPGLNVSDAFNTIGTGIGSVLSAIA